MGQKAVVNIENSFLKRGDNGCDDCFHVFFFQYNM